MLYAGVDEAGLGPLLGPLSAAGVWSEGPPEQVQAQLAGAGLSAKDSKRIYRGKTRLADLETLLLPIYLSRTPPSPEEEPQNRFPARHLFSKTECGQIGEYPWYQELKTLRLPLEADPHTVTSYIQRLRQSGPAVPIGLISGLYTAGEFNQVVTHYQNKSLVLRSLLAPILQTIVRKAESESHSGLELSVDRLGGLKFYRPWLTELFPGYAVQTVMETPKQSGYQLQNPGPDIRITITFSVKEDEHNPLCAVASLFAKYRREILLYLFNDYWQRRGFPKTSGYYRDAQPFLRQIRGRADWDALRERILRSR